MIQQQWLQHKRQALWRVLIGGLALIWLVGVIAPYPVAAAGTVGTGTPASCTEATLRAALTGGGTVSFNCGTSPHTIPLSRAIEIAQATTINGGGLITLDGGGNTRLFSVTSSGQLTLQQITLRNGNAGNSSGGAIRSSGSVTLDGVRLEGNRAADGGALYSGVGTATIRNSIFAGNVATGGGGAINYYHEPRQTGGMVIEASTFAGNQADIGGAIAAGGSGGTEESLLIANSTLLDNQAANSGALYSRSTSTSIIASTFAGNRATEYVAGIFNSRGTLSLANTIMSNDLSGAPENCAGTITNLGGNLQFPGSGCGSSITIADPLLAPLADNGGATPTLLPGQGSPVIDRGAAEHCPATDQRGVVRPTDGNGDGTPVCDIGAVELEAGSTPPAAGNVVGTGTPASCTEAALRAAIVRSGSVTFDCGAAPHTITVSDDLVLEQDTTVDGGGLVAISGGNSTRIFGVESGVSLTLLNLTIRDGREPGEGRGSGVELKRDSRLTVVNCVFENNDSTATVSEFGGGAIYSNKSPITIRSSTFRNNRGSNGGAINITNAQLTIEDSLFENNDATAGSSIGFGFGGAVYVDGSHEHRVNDDGGQFLIRNTTFRNNRGTGEGGAVYSWGYAPDTALFEGLLFENNTVDFNSRSSANGGAMLHGNVPMTMQRTSFISNIARNAGGGLYFSETGTGNLTNVTFYGNRAEGSDGMGGYGGGIGGGGTITCNHCTVLRNHAGDNGGGLYDLAGSTLSNSIIADNTAGNNGNPWNIFQNCRTTLQQRGTVVQFPAKNPTSENDRDCTATPTIAEPQYSEPASNGGRVPTVALLAGSPGIDAGDATTCAASDARGAPRNVGASCDTGAFEFGSEVPVFQNYLPLLVRR